MKYVWVIILGLAMSTGYSQEMSETKHTWKKLSKITFKKVYDELMGFKVDMPVFSDQIKEMEGTEITVKGYIVPTEGYKSHTEFILSAFPYNMCFFCGGAGPETVMEVESLDAVKFTADPIIMTGTLRLNDSDINKLMYKIENARIVKE